MDLTTTAHSSPSDLASLLAALFPPLSNGGNADLTRSAYLAFPRLDGSLPAAYETPPILPPDVFAGAGHILELSGAYHHVVPRVEGRDPRVPRLVTVAQEDIALARTVASAWRSFRAERDFDPDSPSAFTEWLNGAGAAIRHLFEWWHTVFVICGHHAVFVQSEPDLPPLPWWRPALLLLMAADEASRGVGFQVAPLSDHPSDISDWATGAVWTNVFLELRIGQAFSRRDEQADANSTDAPETTAYDGVSTISSASVDIVAVLPKARTAAVGCTMRSLSHHLALLPPRGVARASWTPGLRGWLPADEDQMNLLLVPFPFSIPASAFQRSAKYVGQGVRWGFFDVEQTWLDDIKPDLMLDFLEALAKEANRECGEIHGVIFPELALDQPLYREIAEALPKRLPNIEIFVSGQTGVGPNGSRGHGNFVSFTVYQKSAPSAEAGQELTTRREKHHRWKLDRYQVVDYGLEGILSPSMSWWEDIDHLSRRVDFSVVRTRSVFSAMICEDLARVDPCQELIRAVGPNVIFALLMDAPQLKYRWPARYATVLAEDPGTAVLTLTSRALMTRQHRLGKHPSSDGKDRVIALWRDDEGVPREIECPMEAHAVRLTLAGRRVIDATLDGRDDNSAVSWRYAGHRPVCLKGPPGAFAQLFGDDDVAVRASLSSAS